MKEIVREISIAENKLTYRITSELNLCGVKLYGVETTSSLFGKNETASVNDVSSEYEFTERLLELLADNTVLPSTLQETVEEYVSEQFIV